MVCGIEMVFDVKRLYRDAVRSRRAVGRAAAHGKQSENDGGAQAKQLPGDGFCHNAELPWATSATLAGIYLHAGLGASLGGVSVSLYFNRG
jgi:hypothetical protein